jgi:hypothetical protein
VTQVALYEVESTTYVDLHPVQATVRLDSEWSPYVRVDLTCPLPPADALSRIDPRGVDYLGSNGGDSLLASDLTAQLVTAGITTAAGLTTLWAGKTAAYLTAQYSDPYDASPPAGILRTNLATNPSVEVNTTRFSAYGGATVARVNTWATAGAWSYQATKTVTTQQGVIYLEPRADFVQGDQVTVGVDVVSPTAGVVYTAARIAKSGAPGSAEFGSIPVLLTAGATRRVTFTYTVPAPNAGGTITAVGFQVVDNGGAAGRVLRVDGVTIERGVTDGTRFDGDTPDTFTLDYAWTAAAHASTSTQSAIDAGLATSRRLDVHLRSRDVDYVAGTMRLECTSDEMFLQDFARYDTSTATWTPPATTSLRALVSWALGLYGWTLQPEGTDATIDAAKVIWNLGETLWSFLDAYVRGSGKRLWCDESRKWYLTDSVPTAAGVATIAALTSCTDSLSRADEAYGDAAVMEYTWTDPTGRQYRDYAYTYTTGLTTPKTVVQKFVDQQPAPGAVGFGVARLRTRAMSRGRTIVARAVSSYAVTPGQQALITTPVTTITGALVSAVTWNLPDDQMDVATRDVVT